MSTDNLIPKDIYVDSNAECINVLGNCYIKEINQFGPMSHSQSSVLAEYENCTDCMNDTLLFSPGESILIYNNACIEFTGSNSDNYGTINLHTGTTTISYSVHLRDRGFLLEENQDPNIFSGRNFIVPSVEFASSTTFKVQQTQYKIEANISDSGSKILCFTKDPYNKSCNTFLAFTTVDYDREGFSADKYMLHGLRVSIKNASSNEPDIIQDFIYSDPESFGIEFQGFIEEHFKAHRINIFADLDLYNVSGSNSLFSIISFWKPNGIINSSDVSLFSISEDKSLTPITNDFQQISPTIIGNYDLDSYVNFLDSSLYGRGEKPKFSFTLPSTPKENLSDFLYGDDIVLTFNYDKEYIYNSQMHPTIQSGLEYISSRLNIDFHNKKHGVYSSVDSIASSDLVVLDVWSPCSFELVKSCKLNIVKNSLTVKKIDLEDGEHPDGLFGEYIPDGGAFALLPEEGSEDSSLWGHYIASGDSFNGRPIYKLESLTDETPTASVKWFSADSTWLLCKDFSEDSNPTYELGNGSTPFTNIPITEKNLTFSPGYNGLPTFSNSSGFYIFGETLNYDIANLSPVFYITDTPYSRSGASISISQDLDFIKKLCKYSIH